MAKQKVNLGSKGTFEVNKGGLHRALGIPESETIGPARIDKSLHSKNPKTRRMAASAKGFEGMK